MLSKVLKYSYLFVFSVYYVELLLGAALEINVQTCIRCTAWMLGNVGCLTRAENGRRSDGEKLQKNDGRSEEQKTTGSSRKTGDGGMSSPKPQDPRRVELTLVGQAVCATDLAVRAASLIVLGERSSSLLRIGRSDCLRTVC